MLLLIGVRGVGICAENASYPRAIMGDPRAPSWARIGKKPRAIVGANL